jgi:hypothetical protein
MQLTSTKRLSKVYKTTGNCNNREFNSLTKVEFQELEIQLAEKQMKK